MFISPHACTHPTTNAGRAACRKTIFGDLTYFLRCVRPDSSFMAPINWEFHTQALLNEALSLNGVVSVRSLMPLEGTNTDFMGNTWTWGAISEPFVM